MFQSRWEWRVSLINKMSSFTMQTKNTGTFEMIVAHGKATLLNDIKDLKFTDVVFEDGTQLKDVTFAQLVNASWAFQTKNTGSFTMQAKN